MKKPIAYIVLITAVCALFSGVIFTLKNKGRESLLTDGLEKAILPVQCFLTKTRNAVKNINKEDKHAEENKRLKYENGKLRYEVRKAESIKKENQLLRQMLEISKNNKEFDILFAEVVGRCESSNGPSFKINKGKKDGIKINDTVTVNYSLAGRVSAVGENWAKFMPVVSFKSSVGAVSVTSQIFAVAEGSAELLKDGKVYLFHISEKEKLVLGEQIETSGNESIFPKGLLIGTVSEVLKNGAILDTDIDFNSISEVMIIKRRQE